MKFSFISFVKSVFRNLFSFWELWMLSLFFQRNKMSLMDSVHSNRISSPKFCTRCKICMFWCGRACQWLPVLIIMSIMGWSYYAYVIELCIFTMDNLIQQILYLVFYHILLVMFFWSYLRTIFAELKPIPNKFKVPETEVEKLLSADSEDAQREILENFARNLPIYTRTNSGAIRYCNRCVIVKPDRAHHCSICSRCVLKMDHHCPWVNNCVCFNNYKFFVLFLGYAIMYCVYVAATTLPYFISFWRGELNSHNTSRYHIVFIFFVAFMFLISLASLFGYHCYLVLKNRTTLEAFRSPMFRGGSDRNGFSLGAFNNFKEVFGNDPKLWLLPIFTSLGDGSVFPVRQEHQLQTFAASQEPHGYESMGTTKSSLGDGVVFPLPNQEEDTESLLTAERWDRWGQRSLPFDERESSSLDEL